MISLPTTTVTVYRGSSVDQYGDEDDSNTAVLSKVPCSLLEQRRLVATQDSTQPMIVRYYTARLPYGTDIETGDRLLDEKTNVIYMVDSYAQVQSPFIQGDLRLDLRRVS